MLNARKSLSRTIAVTLIYSILGTLNPAAHAQASASLQSPEVEFLTTSIAIGSQKISNHQMKLALAEAVDTYRKTAPVEGRQQRLSEALVKIGIMNPTRAAAFQQSIEDAMTVELAKNQSSEQAISEALSAAILKTEGAQFSNCAWSVTGIVLFSAGLAASINSYNSITENDYSYSYIENGHTVTVERTTDASWQVLGIIFSSLGLIFSLGGAGDSC